MLNHIQQAIGAEDLALIQKRLAEADWVDGRVTAGSQSGAVKNNSQLPEQSQTAIELGNVILKALGQHPVFLSAALPLHVFPPLFNRYGPGQQFGTHVDNAIRPITGTRQLIRTDLSATLFLADPESYEGGELLIETEFGGQAIKLKAGDMVLYPSTSLHRVKPIVSGTRLASFFWIQSMVRDAQHRSLLHDLDKSVQSLSSSLGQTDAEVVRLTGVYHNLLRQWSEV